MNYTKTTKISCHYNCEDLPDDWQNDYEGADVELAIEESIDERVKELIRMDCREGEFLEYINLDVYKLETPESGWYFHGWITIEEDRELPY